MCNRSCMIMKNHAFCKHAYRFRTVEVERFFCVLRVNAIIRILGATLLLNDDKFDP
ncbi:hypothetical protein HanXRQr2_Chr11g0490451 [Helianthus annuus]|uniref:Uncharacterized protein n=1 Tax=Helianthus annuus TaxID=4232 RepID=A0A251TAS8_HELAN|nr:hypothetical protein HanXRQr2_Chr11g0490451 [Helianthus annuus]